MEYDSTAADADAAAAAAVALDQFWLLVILVFLCNPQAAVSAKIVEMLKKPYN